MKNFVYGAQINLLINYRLIKRRLWYFIKFRRDKDTSLILNFHGIRFILI